MDNLLEEIVHCQADNPAWKWQSHKWDTRLRREESYHDKWEYVRLNPVRKGLAATPEQWPFQGVMHELRW